MFECLHCVPLFLRDVPIVSPSKCRSVSITSPCIELLLTQLFLFFWMILGEGAIIQLLRIYNLRICTATCSQFSKRLYRFKSFRFVFPAGAVLLFSFPMCSPYLLFHFFPSTLPYLFSPYISFLASLSIHISDSFHSVSSLILILSLILLFFFLSFSSHLPSI